MRAATSAAHFSPMAAVLITVLLHGCRGKPSIGESFESIQFSIRQHCQIDDLNYMVERCFGITGDSELVTFLIEQLLTLVVGQPSAVAPIIPAGDPPIGSRSSPPILGLELTRTILQRSTRP